MRLIGMMDSPYVRRVAISLKVLGFTFQHDQLSVFRNFDAFAGINPVVKAPTLVADDGTVLMDSTLMLDYADRLCAPAQRLMPDDQALLLRSLRLIGLSLAACEKTVQIVYEHELRPADKLHQPWLDRVTQQLHAACRELEREIRGVDGWLIGPRIMQPGITLSVTWRFVRHMIPSIIAPEDYPAIAAFSDRAEALPAFQSSPLE